MLNINLNVNSGKICRLIQLAQEFHAKEEVVIPDEPTGPSGDRGLQILADRAEDQTFLEFESIINNLEPDQQQEIVALLDGAG